MEELHFINLEPDSLKRVNVAYSVQVTVLACVYM